MTPSTLDLRFSGGDVGGGSSTIVPLHIDGRYFKSDTGQIIKLLSSTAFRASQVFLTDPPRLTNFLAGLQAMRYNCLRVFYEHGAPADDPFLPPVDLGALNEFHHFAREQGFYVHGVALTCHEPGDNDYIADRQSYFRDLTAMLRDNGHGPFTLLECQNEQFKGDLCSEIPPSMFAGLIACRSCYVSGSPTPDLQWASLHPERKSPPPEADERKVHDLIEIPFGGPRGVGEPNQASNSNPESYARTAALARLLGELWTSHDQWNSVQSIHLPTGNALACFQAAADAFLADVVPVEASGWTYSRDENATGIAYHLGGPLGDNGDDSGAQHVYATDNGSISAGVVTAPGSQWQWASKDGWRLDANNAQSVRVIR